MAPDVPVGIKGPYVLDMGEPVKIIDVAHKMILLLNGKGKDTFVIFTGLRPGEKLNEELFCHDERPVPTGHPMIRVAARDLGSTAFSALPRNFRTNLNHLIALAQQDAEPETIINALRSCVPSYVPMAHIPDADDDWGAPQVSLRELAHPLDAEYPIEASRLSLLPKRIAVHATD